MVKSVEAIACSSAFWLYKRPSLYGPSLNVVSELHAQPSSNCSSHGLSGLYHLNHRL